jgi:hypothetical protein
LRRLRGRLLDLEIKLPAAAGQLLGALPVEENTVLTAV